MDIPYYGMVVVTIAVFLTMYLLRNHRKSMKKMGFISWIALSVYFLIEYIVIQRTTAPYQWLKQPMSDLGVTTCGPDTHPLASYVICSPGHLWMNWTFTLTGLCIIMGAIGLHSCWPASRQTRIATALWVVYGLSYTISGIIPADVNFLWHTLGSLPGMLVQIPALVLIGLAIRKEMPLLSRWTFFCALVTTSVLLLIMLQPVFTQFPGGLLQRIFYAAAYVWMSVTAIALWLSRR
ncbi:hypothetical protein JCM10914A_29310 [Paenibacillus sp. JCM 10914]|uniref:DUF998 domain-containing protein n=1 Tax=Paenibacillus sp. JCM 10914 TaxID=1236974 RepID=UPI0003CC865F|nr:DUF998 domain-containing protein [Paenibacillus sp. JCM 10914]GAE09428.1 hypothetical protein JCM10914_5788 [Paenibacillus sp. JCM 10914]